MRIWSLHPKYLDSKGLVALWRETLLAKKVLEGKTKGYKNHSQLDRLKKTKDPLGFVNYYLYVIWKEAESRSYKFDKSKFVEENMPQKIDVTIGQLAFEKEHLLNKLKNRDTGLYNKFGKLSEFEPNPLFNIIEGEIEPWEKR